VTASTDDDRLLIEAAQLDPARFAELYDRYFERVYAFVSRRTHDRTATEDITSAVFQQALAHLGQFQWRGVPFVAWLFRMHRTRWRTIGGRVRGIPTIRRQRSRTHASSSSSSATSILFQLVDRLPDVQRQVIQLRFVEEKSIARSPRRSAGRKAPSSKLQLRALENLRKGMSRRV